MIGMERRAPLRRSTPMRRSSLRARPLPEAELIQRDRVRRLTFDRDRRCLMTHLASHHCFGGWTFHHLVKASAGGEWSVDNGATLCSGGNVWVEMHPTAAKTLGLVVNHEISAEEAADRRRRHGLIPLLP